MTLIKAAGETLPGPLYVVKGTNSRWVAGARDDFNPDVDGKGGVRLCKTI